MYQLGRFLLRAHHSCLDFLNKVPRSLQSMQAARPNPMSSCACCPLPTTVKFYIILICLPQLLWILSNQHGGILAVCESCSSSNHFYIQLLTTRATDSNCDGRPSELLNTCDIEAKEREKEVREVAQSMNIHKQSYEDHQDLNVSGLCSCSVEESEDMETLKKMEREPHGGWHTAHNLPDLSGPCTIKRRDISLSVLDFVTEFAYKEPVILTGVSDQSLFRAHSTKYRLLKDFGHEVITVATANTHSYRKVKMTLCEYMEKYMSPQTTGSLGNETLYHFGDNDREAWDPLFSLYQLPPYEVPGMEPVLSFGLAGPGTGVPFHIHGPTFAETLYGRKRWFLYPPEHSPVFHPDETTLHWLTHTYPSLPTTETPLECTLHPGEVIYFPDRWWHATLNVDTVVFMSTFYS